MLKTDEILNLLKKTKEPMSFDQIWDKVKKEILKSQKNNDYDEKKIKADIYMSLMEDQNLIMIGDNYWNLKEKYSNDERINIEKTRMTEELEIELEIDDFENVDDDFEEDDTSEDFLES